jgi:hypothetical protein
MMIGISRIMVEVLRYVSFYLALLAVVETERFSVNTKTYRMLKGVRGQKDVDNETIAEGLQRLSQLAAEFSQIQEVDINPYVVGSKSTAPIAIDAMISLTLP